MKILDWAAIMTALTLTATLAACGDGGSERAAAPATPSPRSTTHRTPTTASAWTLLGEEPEGAPLKAGAYGLVANGLPVKMAAVVHVPAGYQNFGGWTFVTPDGEPFRALGYWTVDRVFADPCGAKSQSNKYNSQRDPGPGVEDLAKALTEQKWTTTSEPSSVTIDGYHGLHLTYQMTSGLNIKDCQDHVFDILTASSTHGSWYLEQSGEHAAIWILEVAGERVVLSWVAAPESTRAQLRQLNSMAESTTFEQLDE
jgi:hypothetical protein